uniref:Uncharacterized protein n=1 Tax=viral metagenome TaxID=1070528 RepID=A0A6C0I326_9ZZZZ
MKKNTKYAAKKPIVAAKEAPAPIKATVNVPIKYPSRTFTQREQADKLTGYLEVGNNVWPQIRYGTHIRYYLKTGEFRTGGFVAKNPVEVVISEDNDMEDKSHNGKKMYIKIQNGFNDKLKGFYQWVVAYDDIDKIYIKPDAGVLTMVHTLESIVGNLNENIQKLALTARVLEKRISQLENHFLPVYK